MSGIKYLTDSSARTLLETVCVVASSQGMEYGLIGPTAIKVKKGHLLGPSLTGGELSHVDFTITVELMPSGNVKLIIENDNVFRFHSSPQPFKSPNEFKWFKSLTEEEEFINGVRHELQARGVKILKIIQF